MGAVAVPEEVNAPTSADAIDRMRAMLPEDRIVTSVAQPCAGEGNSPVSATAFWHMLRYGDNATT